VKEELNTPLRNYPDFLEGGARVQIEEGRYPSMEELAIRVNLFKTDEIKHFYISVNITLIEV
jgi:hypothetical protein